MFQHIIGRILKTIVFCSVLAVFSAASVLLPCGKGRMGRNQGATLRVYITLDIPEDIGQGSSGRMEELLAAGKKRAMILLSSYIHEVFPIRTAPIPAAARRHYQ